MRRSGQNAENTPGNSLRLSRAELEALLDDLDRESPESKRVKRQTHRLTMRQVSAMLDVEQPGGMKTRIRVATRNLSRGGASVLHSSYLHVGSRCILYLQHIVEGVVPVSCTIARCRHVRGPVHEIGLKFSRPIDVRDFMPVDPISQAYCLEKVDPQALRGRVLVIADYLIDRQLIEHMLLETSLEVVKAATASDGLRLAKESPDLILLDFDMPGNSGPELLKRLRDEGVRAPLIILSADSSVGARAKIRAANADGFLGKPVAQDLLLRAVGEFLLLERRGSGSASAVQCTLPEDSPMRAIARTFVDDLHRFSDTLGAAVTGNKPEQFRSIAAKIKGTAGALGFVGIAEAADAAIQAIDGTGSLKESRQTALTLVAACKRAAA